MNEILKELESLLRQAYSSSYGNTKDEKISQALGMVRAMKLGLNEAN